MKSKKKLLKDSSLYVIIDKKVCAAKPLSDIARQAAVSGAGIIQLRDKCSSTESIFKEAYAIRTALSGGKTIFIVNDRLDIAKIIGSDGVHLGQNDFSVELARRILGKDKIVGVSCKNLTQAKLAQKQGADYIGVGPIFSTTTKPRETPRGLALIREIRNSVSIPFFVLGGINEDNLKDVLSLGAERIAVCSAVCKSKNPSLSTKRLLKLLH